MKKNAMLLIVILFLILGCTGEQIPEEKPAQIEIPEEPKNLSWEKPVPVNLHEEPEKDFFQQFIN